MPAFSARLSGMWALCRGSRSLLLRWMAGIFLRGTSSSSSAEGVEAILLTINQQIYLFEEGRVSFGCLFSAAQSGDTHSSTTHHHHAAHAAHHTTTTTRSLASSLTRLTDSLWTDSPIHTISLWISFFTGSEASYEVYSMYLG